VGAAGAVVGAAGAVVGVSTAVVGAAVALLLDEDEPPLVLLVPKRSRPMACKASLRPRFSLTGVCCMAYSKYSRRLPLYVTVRARASTGRIPLLVLSACRIVMTEIWSAADFMGKRFGPGLRMTLLMVAFPIMLPLA